VDLGRASPTDVTPFRVNVPFEALAQFSLDGLAFIDESDRITLWNDAASVVTGIASELARGVHVTTVFTNASALFADAGDAPQPVRLLPVVNPHRTINAVILRADDGVLVSFGPQRRFDAIDHVKSEILAAVSHELKTPIATIKAYATTMRQSHDATAHVRDEYLATIEEQADKLNHAVDEMLTAAQADAHHLPMRRVTMPLAPVIDAALAEAGFDTHARPIERSDGSARVCGDPELLREVFAQLLDNALRFSSPTTPVSIAATSDATQTVVRIADRGIGIAAEHLGYIFERFYRVEANLTAASAGTGLGLYIASAIVRAHGGSIAVESETGQGSTFTVTLPVRLA
jgi:signal transduction histidine kinase